MKKRLYLLTFAFLMAGCSHIATRTAPHANLSHFQHVYVQHLLTDGRGIDQLIARELQRLGYDALSGPLTLMPKNTEIIVLYQDRWTFDFTTYMIEIDMQVQTARSGKLLAEGRSFRPSVTGNAPVVLIDEVLKKWFNPHVPPVPQTEPVAP